MTIHALVLPALQLARAARDERRQHETLHVASVFIPTMGTGAVVGKIMASALLEEHLFLTLASLMFADTCLLLMAVAAVLVAAFKAGLGNRAIFAALAAGLALTYPMMLGIDGVTEGVYSAYASTSPMAGLALDLLAVVIVNLLPPAIVAFGAQSKRIVQVLLTAVAAAIVLAQTARIIVLFS